jgi:hypothetical protein
MNSRNVFIIATVFASFLWLAGCEKSNPTQTTTTDKDAMTELVANDNLFSPENSILNDGNPDASLQKTTETIIPKAWGIKILSFDRNINFTMLSDTTAAAVVTNTIGGFVWLYPKDSTKQLVKKNFTEVTNRNVKFVRILRDKDLQKNWKISELSILQGGTTNSGITIQEVVFFIGNDTLDITDPLNYYLKVGQTDGRWRLREVPQSSTAPLFKIQVTVNSTDPDSDIVVAHRPTWFLGHGIYRRAPMMLISSVLNGDGTLTRVYEHSWQGAWTGRHNVVVNAVTRQSIFTDSVAVSSQLWGIPFIVQ